MEQAQHVEDTWLVVVLLEEPLEIHFIEPDRHHELTRDAKPKLRVWGMNVHVRVAENHPRPFFGCAGSGGESGPLPCSDHVAPVVVLDGLPRLLATNGQIQIRWARRHVIVHCERMVAEVESLAAEKSKSLA